MRGSAAIATVVAVVVLVVTASCSSHSDGAETSPTTVSGRIRDAVDADPGESSGWSTDTTIPPGDSVYLVADWEIDVRDLITASPRSSVPDGVTCEGEVRLSIRVDGSFVQSGKPKCEQDRQARSAEIESSGRWRIDGDRLEFSEVEDKGKIYLVKGIEPFTPGLKNGTATFSIDGDTLTLRLDADADTDEVTTLRWQYADPI